MTIPHLPAEVVLSILRFAEPRVLHQARVVSRVTKDLVDVTIDKRKAEARELLTELRTELYLLSRYLRLFSKKLARPMTLAETTKEMAKVFVERMDYLGTRIPVCRSELFVARDPTYELADECHDSCTLSECEDTSALQLPKAVGLDIEYEISLQIRLLEVVLLLKANPYGPLVHSPAALHKQQRRSVKELSDELFDYRDEYLRLPSYNQELRRDLEGWWTLNRVTLSNP